MRQTPTPFPSGPVNTLRCAIEAARKKPEAFTDDTIAVMRAELSMREETRRERIALALLAAGVENTQLLGNNVLLIEAVLDRLEEGR